MKGWTVCGVLSLLMWGTTWAHFHTFIPDNPYGRRGRSVNYTYFWGHPYEHVVFDTPRPVSLFALTPRGKKVDLMGTLKKHGKGYMFSYTPRELGDHIICLDAPPIFVEEEGVFWEDHVKQVLHVMAQKGWDRATGQKIELVPLTRPYGIEAGFVFQAQVLFKGRPLPGATVEVEKYHERPVPEDELPDEPMVTRVVRTDPNGVVTFTLDEPGWWIMCAYAEGGTKEYEGRSYPVELRGGLWVYVEKPFSQ
ncbi:MAG TPA: DUF4198 domain-containing protein [Candidatus Latescibacteria bacterium]|nr:DUF4198 domain-containing protein [Candidatus Latescibacterota bacterium]